jgi:hypothetical protein
MRPAEPDFGHNESAPFGTYLGCTPRSEALSKMDRMLPISSQPIEAGDRNMIKSSV